MKFSRSLASLLCAATVLSSPAFAQQQSTAAAVAESAPAAPSAEPAAAAPPTAVAPSASAPSSQKVIDAIGAPEPGKALVVFFRPSKFAGSAIKFKVREKDVELGKLGSGKFFALQIEPGPHTYVVHSEAKDVTNVEFEAGETYFIVASISMGFMAGHPNLSPSDASAFEAALGKMRKIQTAE